MVMNKYRKYVMTEEDSLFDEEWIKDFEEEDKEYSMFNEVEVNNIKVTFLYTNKRNELEKISEKQIELSNSNVIKKEELIKIIKGNDKLDKIKYKLISILIYNFSLKNDDLKYFLKNTDSYDFMNSLKNIDDYRLTDSINCLQDVNNLYILFTEDDKKICVKDTKRIKFNIVKGNTRRKK